MDFKQEDVFEGLKTGEGKADLIFSSYALHHLMNSDKERFFQLAHQRLAEQGMLLLIDVAREENEDRATYLDNYCGWIQSDWKGFPQPALDAIFEHIRQNDFPETSAVCHAMAAKAGFPRGVDVNRFLWHHVWSFDKGA